jgi:hypothetical protein
MRMQGLKLYAYRVSLVFLVVLLALFFPKILIVYIIIFILFLPGYVGEKKYASDEDYKKLPPHLIYIGIRRLIEKIWM